MPGRRLFRYTLEEVTEHNSIDDLWVIHNNRVYDVTDFVKDHPGGEEVILSWAGKDISRVMSDVISHEHSTAAYSALAELCIGELINDNSINNSNTINNANGNVFGILPPEPKPINNPSFPYTTTDINSDLKEKFLDLNKPLFYQMFKCNFNKEFYLSQIHKPRHLPYSAKLFGNPLLEFFTKTSWHVIPILWLPLAIYHLYMASESLGVKTILTLFIIGIGIWTLLEYTLHRFIFHVDKLLPDHPYALCLHFLLHGIHHYLPMDRLRLVMPPVLGLAISFPITTIGYLLFPENVSHALIAGAMFGYVCYDLTHYHLHHARPFNSHLREMKTYHLDHHYKNYDLGYGITNKFWDRTFGTLLM